MLIKKDKLFIKGYKTYRAEGNVRRKGVLTLISEQMDCITFKTIMDEENGRFLQTKLKDNKGTGEIIFNNVYLEPDNQNKEVIPIEIWESEHIARPQPTKNKFRKIFQCISYKNME